MNTIKCIECGFIYANPIQIRNSSHVTLSGVNSQCPRCGHLNNAAPGGIDGAYDFDNEGNAMRAGLLKILREAQLDANSIKELQQITEDAKANSLSLSQFISAIAVVNPSISEGLESLFKDHQFTANALYVFLALLTFLYTVLHKTPSQPSVQIVNHNYNLFPQNKAKSTQLLPEPANKKWNKFKRKKSKKNKKRK